MAHSTIILLHYLIFRLVQGQIQDLILDNVTTDWPFYDDDK